MENELFARLLCFAANALQPSNVFRGHMGQERKIRRVPPRVGLVGCQERRISGRVTYQRHICIISLNKIDILAGSEDILSLSTSISYMLDASSAQGVSMAFSLNQRGTDGRLLYRSF